MEEAPTAHPVNGEQRVVAFVDILGFRARVRGLTQPAEFPPVVDALRGGSEIRDVPEADLGKQLARERGGEQFDVAMERGFFSDCAVFSARDTPGAPFAVAETIVEYARRLLGAGLFLRGGMAVGLLAHRNNLVVGPALLDAYDMETKAAVYPRIVIADELARRLLRAESGPNPRATVRLDEDGLFILDLLTTLGQRDDGEELLAGAHELIAAALATASTTDLIAKWRWMAGCYHLACKSAATRLPRIPLPNPLGGFT